ncbi:hypothetical protein BUALT_Bualt02G0229000 [Buddleja alternifolia]|uniref:Peptidase A1 domain-containing protein n=1 Tax=Buddleja alternifolia TaxID=168488 RepID=A0AAV6Y3Z0_9LAMI|nr:hypothetical protein BUALT_Bualt02G0229000 [Buddleja alternifolia]
MAIRSYKLLFFLGNFLHVLLIFEAAKSSGMSIKLIHMDSPESPFYPGVATRSSKIERLLSTTLSLDITTNNSQDIIGTMSVCVRMDNRNLMYLVEAGVGTFAPPSPPYNKYFLHLDTASDVTCTQCEDCRKMGSGSCSRQAPPLFPAKRSRTYRPLPCGRHELCFPAECISNMCSYHNEYADGAMTLGVPNSRPVFVLPTTMGRCHNFTVFLQFGDDIPQRKGLKTTVPMLSIPGSPFHHIVLKGASVGKQRVDIPPRMLGRRDNHYGGCIVDSGSALTLMPPPVYKKLEKMLIKTYFSRYRRVRNRKMLPLCYLFPSKTALKDLPNITFHLEDSDFVFRPQALYIIDRISSGEGYFFCLGIVGRNIQGMTLIGTLQQANTRFIFDTLKHKLHFGPEDCTLGT